MVNYQNSKIYKLVSNDLIYYTATTNNIRYHMHHLKIKSKKGDYNLERLFNNCSKIRTILIMAYPCNNKEELNNKLNEIILNNECIN